MKKRILPTVLFLLTVVLLCGCAVQDAPAAGQATLPSEDTVQSFPGLGGKMPEMTFKTSEGETLTLSALLEKKELVVLNFWFEDCPWCLREFPVMEVAYQQYRQDVEIVALNPVDGKEAIKAFQEKKSLSFPMVSCPRSWAVASGVSGYPTSIFIDRDGVVCLIHAGAITSTDDWYALFDAFTGEDYQRKIYHSVQDVLQ